MSKQRPQNQLACFDLDGSLVDGLGNLYPGACDLVEQARQRGWTALCSARPMFSLQRHISLLGEFDFLSSCQGAFISKRMNGRLETISYEPLLSEHAKGIYEIAVTNSVETWMIGKVDWFSINRRGNTKLEEEILDSESKAIDELVSQDILKVVMVDAQASAVEAIARLGLYYATSKSNFLEISTTDFAKGVPRIAASLSLNKDSISCLGDGMNDLSMFNACNTSITFEDSSEALRTAAAFVVPPAAKGGLLHASRILSESEKY